MTRYGLDVKAVVRLCITWWVGVPMVRQFHVEFTSILPETKNIVTFRDISDHFLVPYNIVARTMCLLSCIARNHKASPYNTRAS